MGVGNAVEFVRMSGRNMIQISQLRIAFDFGDRSRDSDTVMIRRSVLKFLQCPTVASFTKLQFFDPAFARKVLRVGFASRSPLYAARFLDEKSP